LACAVRHKVFRRQGEIALKKAIPLRGNWRDDALISHDSHLDFFTDSGKRTSAGSLTACLRAIIRKYSACRHFLIQWGA